MKFLKGLSLLIAMVALSSVSHAFDLSASKQLIDDAREQVTKTALEAAATGSVIINKAVTGPQIATGTEGGNYWKGGLVYSRQLFNSSRGKIDMKPRETGGTVENVQLFNDRVVNAMFCQEDGCTTTRRIAAQSLYPERVIFIANKEHGFDDFGDLEGNKEFRIMRPLGAGGEVTLKRFVSEDAGYARNLELSLPVNSNYEALTAVADGFYKTDFGTHKVAGMIYVGGKIPEKWVKEFGDRVIIGEATDKDFDDAKGMNGDYLYTDCKVTENVANGMDVVTIFGWPDTVCVNAMLVVAIDQKGQGNKFHLQAAKSTVNEIKASITE